MGPTKPKEEIVEKDPKSVAQQPPIEVTMKFTLFVIKMHLVSFKETSSTPPPGAAGASGTGKEKDTQREILQERIDLYKVITF